MSTNRHEETFVGSRYDNLFYFVEGWKFTMGLLTILKKMKQKEKEMRLLMLYVLVLVLVLAI